MGCLEAAKCLFTVSSLFICFCFLTLWSLCIRLCMYVICIVVSSTSVWCDWAFTAAEPFTTQLSFTYFHISFVFSMKLYWSCVKQHSPRQLNCNVNCSMQRAAQSYCRECNFQNVLCTRTFQQHLQGWPDCFVLCILLAHSPIVVVSLLHFYIHCLAFSQNNEGWRSVLCMLGLSGSHLIFCNNGILTVSSVMISWL